MAVGYWQQHHQAALIEYITCTGITSGTTQHRLFNTVLYQPLCHLAKQALYSTGIAITDDNIQEILTHIYESILPKVSKDKAAAFLQYAYTSAKNLAITSIYLRGTKRQEFIGYTDCLPPTEGSMNADDLVSEKDIKIQIIEKLDQKIKEQKILNRTNTIYLLLLRQYILDHDYDTTGFKSYCMKTMRI